MFDTTNRRYSDARTCAFLTTDDLDGVVLDDGLAVEPLSELGWKTFHLSWRQRETPWSEFDLVVVRSTWDYQGAPDEFLQTLTQISEQTRLANSLRLIQWNIRKTYLLELADRGIGVVPTVSCLSPSERDLSQLFERFETDNIVVKPSISASAQDTFSISSAELGGRVDSVVSALRGREAMIQPFMAAITEEGEYSVIFMGGEYSHTILKTPKDGDFRVQEEHGGQLGPVSSPDPMLLSCAREVMLQLDETPLYARVDLIRAAGSQYLLMELELIEPSLYLHSEPGAPVRFARAIDSLS